MASMQQQSARNSYEDAARLTWGTNDWAAFMLKASEHQKVVLVQVSAASLRHLHNPQVV